MTPYNYGRPDWGPLERAIGLAFGTCLGSSLAEACGKFLWTYENPAGWHHYKHRDSRLYVCLTADMEPGLAVKMLRSAIGGRPGT